MIDVLKRSATEFLQKLNVLLLVAFPWILAISVLVGLTVAYVQPLDASLLLLSMTTKILLQAIMVLFCLRALLKSRCEVVEISAGKILISVLAAVYIGIATALGLSMLVIPGIIIMAAAFFTPLFILQEEQGPIDAIASSASLLRGRIFHVTLFLCVIWLAIYAIEYLLGLLLDVLPVNQVVYFSVQQIIASLISLTTLPVMVNLKEFLIAEQQVQEAETVVAE